MSGTALPRRRPSSLTVAIALSLAVHAVAAVMNFGSGRSRDPVIEPTRSVPLRLLAASRPAALPQAAPGAQSAEAAEPTAPGVKPAPQTVIKRDARAPHQAALNPHAHPLAHPHSHPHAAARTVESMPKRSDTAKPTATQTQEAIAVSDRAATPVPHGAEPRLASQPLEASPPERVPEVAAAAPIPASAVAPAEQASQASIESPATAPAPVMTAAVAPPARAGGNDDRIEPPHYNVAYLNNPKPDYPAAARRMRLQGAVIVRAMVEPSGRASDLKIQRSSGVELLDEAALRAVRDYRFVPAKRGSEVVTHWVDVPFTFRLTE